MVENNLINNNHKQYIGRGGSRRWQRESLAPTALIPNSIVYVA